MVGSRILNPVFGFFLNSTTPRRFRRFTASKEELQGGFDVWFTNDVHRVTSIYQPTNAHIISYKTLLKHSDMFRSCQIIIRELSSLLNLYYGIHNSILICKRGVVAAYRVVLWSSWLGVRRTTHT